MAITEARVSRKSLLKRAGVGAAALGGVSMATAATASADAAPSKSCTVQGCGSNNQCGEYNNCLGHDCCYCWVTTEGCCFCGQDYFCNATISCTSSKGCPGGWACAFTCCGGSQCVPPCGKNIPGLTVCLPPSAPATSARVGSRG